MTEAGIVDLTSFLLGGAGGEVAPVEGYTPLSYPIVIPPVSGVREVAWGRDEVRGISESPFSLHRTTYRHQGERWRVAVTLPPMSRANAAAWDSFLLMLDGGCVDVLFGDVFNPSPRGLAYGAPLVDGGAQTGRILNTKGWQENVTGILLAGDRIQIGTRYHQVLRDANSDATGRAILDIWPRLRESPSNNLPIITLDPKGLFKLAAPGGSLSEVGLSRIHSMPSFVLIESI